MVEIQGPAQAETESLRPDGVIDIRYRRLSNWMVLSSLAMAVLTFLNTEVFVPKNAQVGRDWLPLLYGIWLFFIALGCVSDT